MSYRETHTVTGAFGFTGRYIAGLLLERGYNVRTLTNSPNRENLFNNRIRAFPYNFDNFDALVNSLKGTRVLYNNYWVRFNHPLFSYREAIENSIKLFEAAKQAGVEKIVHISITNPSEDSPFEYFRGKAILERSLIESGLSYAILRPAIIFGKEDILINNIAWFLRRFPVFGVFGDGNYRVQPIYVEDLARLAVEYGENDKNIIIDAIGPETFTYRELVTIIGKAIGKPRPIISIPPLCGFLIGRLTGVVQRDTVITWDEIKGLMSNLLFTNSPPAGNTRFSEWIKEHSQIIGIHYSSELQRRIRGDRLTQTSS